MIRLSGHREEDIPIVFTGLRPGEKLYEELLADEESTDATTVQALRRARLRDDLRLDEARQWIHALGEDGPPWPDAAVRRHLQQLVPEYAESARPAEPAEPAKAGP